MSSPNETRTASDPASGQGTGPDPLLTVRDLHVRFEGRRGRVDAVCGASFDVLPGEMVALVGRSGSGKSVTLSAIAGLITDPPGIVAGRIRFRGRDILPEPQRYGRVGHDGVIARRSFSRHRALQRAHDKVLADVRGTEIGLVLQDPYGGLDPQATIEAQLVATMRANRPRWPKGDRTNKAWSWLTRVGLDADRVLPRYPRALSGGMCQRVMLALGLIAGPRLLLADEPTSALDPTVGVEILDLLAALGDEHRTAVLLVTHDIGLALRYASRILVMHEGRVVDEGPRSRFQPPLRGPLSIGPGIQPSQLAADLHPEAARLLAAARTMHAMRVLGRDAV